MKRRLKILTRWFVRRFGYGRVLCVVLLLGFAFARIADFRPVEEIRVRIFDTYQFFAPRLKHDRPVAIVDIDEKSLEKFGQWPWPRNRIAALIDALGRL